MAKGKQASPSKKARYSRSFATTQTNKARNVASEKKRVESNAKKEYRVPRGSARSKFRKNGGRGGRNVAVPFDVIGQLEKSEGYARIASAHWKPNAPRVIYS